MLIFCLLVWCNLYQCVLFKYPAEGGNFWNLLHQSEKRWSNIANFNLKSNLFRTVGSNRFKKKLKSGNYTQNLWIWCNKFLAFTVRVRTWCKYCECCVLVYSICWRLFLEICSHSCQQVSIAFPPFCKFPSGVVIYKYIYFPLQILVRTTWKYFSLQLQSKYV